jgi:hypothetical protein
MRSGLRVDLAKVGNRDGEEIRVSERGEEFISRERVP